MRRLSAEELDRVRDALLNGMTVAQAARATGISRGSVTGVAAGMRAEGIPVMRAPQGRKPRPAT